LPPFWRSFSTGGVNPPRVTGWQLKRPSSRSTARGSVS
jgi:hypothetical protein